MKGSRCAAGHGAWTPPRARCPACAGPVEAAELPDAGQLLVATARGGRAVGIVRLGDAYAPALLDGDPAEGERVDLHEGADGLLVARPARYGHPHQKG